MKHVVCLHPGTAYERLGGCIDGALASFAEVRDLLNLPTQYRVKAKVRPPRAVADPPVPGPWPDNGDQCSTHHTFFAETVAKTRPAKGRRP